MSFLIEILLEIVLQVLVESLFELALQSAGHLVLTRIGEVVKVGAYAILGIALGFVGVIVFPRHLVDDAGLRLAGRILNPFLMGIIFVFATGWLRRDETNNRQPRVWRFAEGFAFGCGYSAVRFYFGG